MPQPPSKAPIAPTAVHIKIAPLSESDDEPSERTVLFGDADVDVPAEDLALNEGTLMSPVGVAACGGGDDAGAVGAAELGGVSGEF